MSSQTVFLQIVANTLIAGGIYTLIALGFTLIYFTVRFFHLAHGAVYTLGAFTAYAVLIMLPKGGNITLLAIVGIGVFVVTGLVGLMMDRLLYKSFRRRRASGLVLLLLSFGLFVLLENCIGFLFGSQVRTPPAGLFPTAGFEFGGAVITSIQAVIVIFAFVMTMAAVMFVRWTRFGNAFRAVADDPILADTTGIDPERMIAFAFFFGSGLAGVAGMLVSFESNLDPAMGFAALLKGVIAAIIGGIGSFAGIPLGALFLSLAENVAAWFLPAAWKDSVAFGLLIIFLLFRPQGILGVRRGQE